MISALVPAYNEQNTIEEVINTVKNVQSVDEIIVISDGSKDKTAEKARGCGVVVIELHSNMGKGAALKEGLDLAKGDTILLLDADLIGLTAEHIQILLAPVVDNQADMTIGVFTGGRFSTNFSHRVSPQLSGQRAIKREVLNRISNLDLMGYGIETALNTFAKRANIRVREVELKGITHIMKEEKLGLVRGFAERMKMYWHILKGFHMARR